MSKILKRSVEHVQIPFDAANAVTGLLANYKVGPVACKVKAGFYVKTQADAGQLIDIGNTATENAQATNILDGGSAITGAQGGPGETIATTTVICAANSYITAYNVSSSTPAVATGIEGYLDLEIIRYPVRVGDE